MGTGRTEFRGDSSRWMTAFSRTAGAVIAALFLVPVLAGPASAHTLPERQRVLLSVAPGEVQLLIVWDAAPVGVAEQIWQAVDANANGVVDIGWEQIAMAQLVLPRLQAGLSVQHNGVPVQLELANYAWNPGEVEGTRRGLGAAAMFTASWSESDAALHTWAVAVSTATSEVTVEIQAVPPWSITSSTLPWVSGDAVAGPGRALEGDLCVAIVERTPTP
jgi:hypothetical protein